MSETDDEHAAKPHLVKVSRILASLAFSFSTKEQTDDLRVSEFARRSSWIAHDVAIGVVQAESRQQRVRVCIERFGD